MNDIQNIRIGIHGCDLGTGNLGVSALAISLMSGLHRELPTAEFTLFSHDKLVSQRKILVGEKVIEFQSLPLTAGMRVDRPSNLRTMRLMWRLGVGTKHPILKRILELDVVLDISGGDSFTDLYGARRVNGVMKPKEFFLDLGIPLILAPQTYGPFRKKTNRVRAAKIINKCNSVWVRDVGSEAEIKKLLAEHGFCKDIDSAIDVAFGLPMQLPESETVKAVDLIRRSHKKVVGVNISGLLVNTTGVDKAQYGFRDGYAATLLAVLGAALEDEKVGVMLIPHVLDPCAAYEDDVSAARTVVEKLDEERASRVYLIDDKPAKRTNHSPMEMKWVISQCDHFCGTRMHACIASTSLGIPTTAIAYSDKASRVFHSISLGNIVVDGRKESRSEIVKTYSRDISEEAVDAYLYEPETLSNRLNTQFRDLADQIKAASI